MKGVVCRAAVCSAAGRAQQPGVGTREGLVPQDRDARDAQTDVNPPASPHPDVAAAALEVFRYLQARLEFTMWLVTRPVGEHQVVLHARDAPQGYGGPPGRSWTGAGRCARGWSPATVPTSPPG